MTREEIISVLKQYKHLSEYKDNIKELGLFGSYSKGLNTNKSDIDIFIKLEPARMFDLISIKYDLEKIFGKKVDIVAMRKTMNQYLQSEINSSGIYA